MQIHHTLFTIKYDKFCCFTVTTQNVREAYMSKNSIWIIRIAATANEFNVACHRPHITKGRYESISRSSSTQAAPVCVNNLSRFVT